jgi:hypothetical protein
MLEQPISHSSDRGYIPTPPETRPKGEFDERDVRAILGISDGEDIAAALSALNVFEPSYSPGEYILRLTNGAAIRFINDNGSWTATRDYGSPENYRAAAILMNLVRSGQSNVIDKLNSRLGAGRSIQQAQETRQSRRESENWRTQRELNKESRKQKTFTAEQAYRMFGCTNKDELLELAEADLKGEVATEWITKKQEQARVFSYQFAYPDAVMDLTIPNDGDPTANIESFINNKSGGIERHFIEILEEKLARGEAGFIKELFYNYHGFDDIIEQKLQVNAQRSDEAKKRLAEATSVYEAEKREKGEELGQRIMQLTTPGGPYYYNPYNANRAAETEVILSAAQFYAIRDEVLDLESERNYQLGKGVDSLREDLLQQRTEQVADSLQPYEQYISKNKSH